jgi:DNA repair protein RadC
VPHDAAQLCRALCGGYEHERFGAIWLDTRHRVLHAETLFLGTIDGATVYRVLSVSLQPAPWGARI